MEVLIGRILFVLFSLIIAAADIKTGMIPRLAFVIAFPLFFILLCMFGEETFFPVMAIAGMLVGLFVFLLAYLITGKKLGLADVWYSALIGMVLGPWWWYAAIGCACTIGIMYMLISKRQKIPFIPLMALGSIAIVFFLEFLKIFC